MITTSTPVLSILVPTFNRAAILRLTLKHLLSEIQKLEGLVEVVIGDNASTDETSTVLEDLPSEYSRSIRRVSNIGAWRNIVALATVARGDWVLILGDDDFLMPNTLIKLVTNLHSSQGVELIGINYGWINANILKASLEKGEEIKVPHDRMWMVSHDMSFKNGPDLYEQPSSFAAGSFAALFGFAVRRDTFNDYAKDIKPGLLTDGFNEFDFVLEDAFPHSILALEIIGTRPMNLLSDVYVLQGVGGWEWKKFLYRTVIIGHVWLFHRFKSVVPKAAWFSLASYAGVRLARMIKDPVSNLGFFDIQKSAVPSLMIWPIFESSFVSECDRIGIGQEGIALLKKWKDVR